MMCLVWVGLWFMLVVLWCMLVFYCLGVVFIICWCIVLVWLCVVLGVVLCRLVRKGRELMMMRCLMCLGFLVVICSVSMLFRLWFMMMGWLRWCLFR